MKPRGYAGLFVVGLGLSVGAGCQRVPVAEPASAPPSSKPTAEAPPSPPAETPARHFPDSRFPLLEVERNRELFARFDTAPFGSQPWLRGDRQPPLTLRDLGLVGRLSLADLSGGVAEWGMRVLVVDGHGNMFGFCTHQKVTPDGDLADVFDLGVLTPNKTAVHVTEGSPSYRFLHALVWSFAKDARYQPSQATLQRARTSAHLSEAELEELRRPPPGVSTEPMWNRRDER
jgi:hypothetical protein